MKIGVDIRTLMDAQYSGVSEYSLNLIKEILKLDTENKYQLFYNSYTDCPNLPEFRANNAEIVRYNFPNKILNYLFFKFFNWPKIDQELGVEIFFMPHINFIGLTRKSSQPPLSRGSIKKVLTVHDLSFLRYPEFFSWRKNFWHRMVKVKKLVKRFDTIVAVSENTKRDIVELCGVDEDKVKVIYAGVGEEYRKMVNGYNEIIPPAPFIKGEKNADEKKLLEVKNKYNLPEKFILYLGTVEPRKNVEGIIAAYNQLRVTSYELRDYKLVIAGGRGWKNKKIYQEREESKFKDDIKFLDYVAGEDKVYLYNLASVFVYPSFYEGFGLPPLEAMACGLPVVASYVSSLPEVAGDAAMMVDPYNISDLASALMEILTDDNLRNKLIARGLERARKFNWIKTAKEYLEILNQLK